MGEALRTAAEATGDFLRRAAEAAYHWASDEYEASSTRFFVGVGVVAFVLWLLWRRLIYTCDFAGFTRDNPTSLCARNVERLRPPSPPPRRPPRRRPDRLRPDRSRHHSHRRNL